MLDFQHNELLSQHNQTVLDWVSQLSFGKEQTDYLRARQAGTGTWLLQSTEYNTWVSGSAATLLCTGDPGTGKTILASIAIDDVFERFRTQTDVGIGYVYCNYRRKDELISEALLASLARQLVGANLPKTFETTYARNKQKGTKPLLDEISACLCDAASKWSRFISSSMR